MLTQDPMFSEFRLVNQSTGDPALFIDFPGRNDALLFDSGENDSLPLQVLGDLEAVFITHHHVDHFIGFDRIVRANLDRDKTLKVFGPDKTIQKIYNRIKSYEYQFFPFQKVIIDVHEVLADRIRFARLECTQRFPRPKIVESERSGPVIYQNEAHTIEAVLVEHTVPCLAYALVEKPQARFEYARLAGSGLVEGGWIGQLMTMLRKGEAESARIKVHGTDYTLGELKERLCSTTTGARVAYVTDTCWSEAVRPALIQLAWKAQRLYCDSFYAEEQLKQAVKHKHMTATQAANFATEASVSELVLIHFSTRYQGDYDRLVEEARASFPRVSAEIPFEFNKKSPRASN